MELENAEWGFVPSEQAIVASLDALWAPRAEWGMGDPEEDMEEADAGHDPVCVWQG